VKRSYLAVGIVIFVLLIDQILKFWIKTTYPLGGGFDILGLDWAKIHFVENEGMAFGMELGGNYGKLILSIFRIVAVLFIGYYLYTLIKTKTSWGLIASIALVLAGAMGNIIDSVFYGVIFSESSFAQIAQYMPADGGYTTILHGHVVDMFYFPMAQGSYPDWMPLIGGKFYLFFRPVFNVADAAISVGVISILIFQRSIFVTPADEQKTTSSTDIISDEDNTTDQRP